jgi:hypothetical protein
MIVSPARALACGLTLVLLTSGPAPAQKSLAKYPVKLVEPLPFGEEFVEATESGTLRRRYRVWGDYEAEMLAWKSKARASAGQRSVPPRPFRLVCVFLKDATIDCPGIMGNDGKALRATFSTPPVFEKKMRERVAQEYSDFTEAFTGGAVECQWLFTTVSGLHWSATGEKPAWSCQPRAIADQVEMALANFKDKKVDMWVYCAGRPTVLNGNPKQTVAPPPFGISYTQWPLYGGYSIVCCAPLLPLIVHEVNHRYLDNLAAIEGVQLTMFHGLNNMGYETGDLGYPDLLAVYRSVYLHVIRPAMWRRFSLSGPPTAKPEPFSGKLYSWAEVADDCWFKLPLLGDKELAQLTGVASLKLVADRKTRWRQLTVGDGDLASLRSAYSTDPGEKDTALNNVLSLMSESCAVLATNTGTWFIVRPELAEVFVEKADKRRPLEAAGWLNEGVRPLLVLRGSPDLQLPAKEIGLFR